MTLSNARTAPCLVGMCISYACLIFSALPKALLPRSMTSSGRMYQSSGKGSPDKTSAAKAATACEGAPPATAGQAGPAGSAAEGDYMPVHIWGLETPT